MPTPKWEYYVETFNLTERWGSKRQADEVQKFIGRLNAIGAEGWELVTQAEVTMKGGITGAVKGELTTCFFKRVASD
jgi:hypothetical protein